MAVWQFSFRGNRSAVSRLLNYFSLRKFSLLYAYYAIIDAPEYLADALFVQNKVRVSFGPEYSSPDYLARKP